MGGNIRLGRGTARHCQASNFRVPRPDSPPQAEGGIFFRIFKVLDASAKDKGSRRGSPPVRGCAGIRSRLYRRGEQRRSFIKQAPMLHGRRGCVKCWKGPSCEQSLFANESCHDDICFLPFETSPSSPTWITARPRWWRPCSTKAA